MKKIVKSLGCLYIVVAPSGAGKSSLVNALLKREPSIRLSVSYTTRPPRPGEKEGEHYHFIDEIAFENLRRQGVFLEYAEVHGNFYGTSKDWLTEQLQSGQDVLLEIDWQGARQVRKFFPDSTSIFILPPSFEALEHRLRTRGQDSETVIAKRLLNAGSEIEHTKDCEFVIVNDVFDDALNALHAIVGAARQRYAVQKSRHGATFKELGA